MRDKPKVVFDTNIFISAVLFGGNPRECLELARKGEIELVTSRPVLLELAQKLRDKFLREEKEIAELIGGILVFSKLVSPRDHLKVAVDETDNRILECAQEAKANFIISGDKKHLLSLKKFEGIPIISAKEFLDRFFEKKTN